MSSQTQIKICRAVGGLQNANDHLFPGVRAACKPGIPMVAPVTAAWISMRFDTPGFSSRSCRTAVSESVTADLIFLVIAFASSRTPIVPCGDSSDRRRDATGFGNGGEIEYRQQVDISQAGGGQSEELREGEPRQNRRGGGGARGRRWIAHQFIAGSRLECHPQRSEGPPDRQGVPSPSARLRMTNAALRMRDGCGGGI